MRCRMRTSRNGIAPAMVIILMTSMSFKKVKPAPMMPKTTPQASLRLGVGLRSPSLLSMPSTKVALSAWLQLLPLSIVVCLSMSYLTLADGPAGKALTSSTTELVSEMWPRALA